MIASNFRISTKDVDAVARHDQTYLDAVAARIARDRSWPDDWLNDGVRTYLSPLVEGFEQHEWFGSYPDEANPGLRVFIPSPSYLLAMKLIALRTDITGGKSDVEDIVNLVQVVGLKRKEELVSLTSGFYPEARTSGKILLALDDLWAEIERRREEHSKDAPQFLGRGRPTDP